MEDRLRHLERQRHGGDEVSRARFSRRDVLEMALAAGGLEPVRGARLEVWQANAAGRYDHPSDTNPAPLDPSFQGYCIIKTDADGRYRFKSIKPGAYPIGPGVVRPPHIHFEVLGHRDRLVTQMYFPEDPLNEKDDIFRQLGRFKGAAIGKVLPPTKELEPDSKLVLWDIVLDRG